MKGDADLDVDQDPAAAAAPAQDPMKVGGLSRVCKV